MEVNSTSTWNFAVTDVTSDIAGFSQDECVEQQAKGRAALA